VKKILLCDDEVHILRAAEFKLKRAGYEVRCASDGQEGWEMIQQELPDVVVTDLQMPRMTGLDLARAIKENETTRHVPVLMLSAKGYEAEFTDQAKECGIIGVLAKPFSPRELLSIVQQILESGTAKLPMAYSGTSS
jgi:two-component system alkaline phosphatase synthesis response regulator PhoP